VTSDFPEEDFWTGMIAILLDSAVISNGFDTVDPSSFVTDSGCDIISCRASGVPPGTPWRSLDLGLAVLGLFWAGKPVSRFGVSACTASGANLKGRPGTSFVVREGSWRRPKRARSSVAASFKRNPLSRVARWPSATIHPTRWLRPRRR